MARIFFEDETEFLKIKTRIVDLSLVFASLIGLITYLITLFRVELKGFHLSNLTNLLVLILILGITLFRKKIGLLIKVNFILFCVFLVILFDLMQYGLLASNKVFIVIVPFFALLAYSVKRSLIIFSGFVIMIFVVGYLITTGKNPYFLYEQLDITDIGAWLINFLIIILVAITILFISYKFIQFFQEIYKVLQNKNLIIAEKERNYREIYNSGTDAIAILGFDFKIIDVNLSFINMYGFETDELTNASFIDFCSTSKPLNDFDIELNLKETIRSGEKIFEWQAVNKQGKPFWVEIAVKKTKILGNERLIAVIRDVTKKKEITNELEKYRNHLEELVNRRTYELEQKNKALIDANEEIHQQKEEVIATFERMKQMQAQLIHSEKMASLGVLTAGVAHEINNPLNYVQSGIYAMETFFSDSSECEFVLKNFDSFQKILGNMQTGVERINSIVNGLSHFTSQNNKSTESCDIHLVLENCLSILESQYKYKANIVQQYCPGKYTVIGNESKLHQAFLNIILNSIQAIEENGEIKITTELEQENLIITVKDNGKGMSAEILDKIFDPFFTTRDVGKGTGLGLSIAYGIIYEHNGVLQYISDVDKGTTAIIILPAKNEEI